MTSVQSALVVTHSRQSSKTSGRNARALADLALHDLTASFDPKLLRQVNLKALASLTFPTVAGGWTEEGKLEVMAA